MIQPPKLPDNKRLQIMISIKILCMPFHAEFLKQKVSTIDYDQFFTILLRVMLVAIFDNSFTYIKGRLENYVYDSSTLVSIIWFYKTLPGNNPADIHSLECRLNDYFQEVGFLGRTDTMQRIQREVNHGILEDINAINSTSYYD